MHTLTLPISADTLALVPAASFLRFAIPSEDAPEFYSANYSDVVRAEVTAWLRILQRVHNAPRSVRTGTMRIEARIAGKSFGAVSAKYYAFVDSHGDWRVLVNRKRKGSGARSPEAENLPHEFRAHVARIAGNNKRSFAAAYVQLVAGWRRWRKHARPDDAIPGYRVAPEPDEKGRHPHGWSKRNLYRFVPKTAALTIARIGTAAATEFLPCIPGTRKGLRFLEFVSFDDVWNDRDVVVAHVPDPCRLLQLGAFDLASGDMLKVGVRPELPNADTGRRERLKKLDMLMLVAAFLAEYGYPLDYTMHLILERGTATLYAPEAKALFDYSGGRIVCCYTSMQGQLVAAWDESRTGNPRGKGAHESWHNLLHNWSASEPGQMGKDRNHTPAVLAAQQREARDLNTVALVLSDAQRAELRLPFQSLDKAHARVLEIVAEINNREDHACEGFDVTTDWRIKGVPMDWQPEGSLVNVPEAMRANLEYFQRVETPHQRMLRMSAATRVAKIPGNLLRAFVEDCRVKKSIERAGFRFTYEGKDYEYLAPDVSEALRDGTLLTGHFSPLDMSVVHLTDEDGIFVGTWRRFGPFLRGSAEQAEAQRVRGAYLAQAVRQVQRTHAPDLAREQARMDNNLRVVSEAGLIPAPAARTLAQVAAHVAPQADRLEAAIETHRAEQRREADARAKHQRSRILATEHFAGEPAPDHAVPTQETPVAENDEGFDAGVDADTQPDRPTRRRILSAADFS